MKFRNISKLLAGVLLLTNLNIDSFAGTLSEDSRYETFTGNNITVNDILEEDKVNIEIEGSTLVNILNYDAIDGADSHWDYNYDDRVGYMSLIDKTDTYKGIRFNINKEVDLKKEYTMFINITKNTMTRYDNEPSNHIAKISLSSDSGYENVKYINSSETGIIKYLFKPTEIANKRPYISVLPQSYNGEFEFKDFMIIEGNHLDKNIEFFEGIKSSFEDKLITQEMIDSGQEKAENLGKYKVEITIGGGKNLFNKNNVQEVYIDGNENIGSIADTVSGLNRSSNWIPCKPNTYYTVSGGQRNRWLLKNDKGELTYIGETIGTETPTIRTNPDTVEFMCYVVHNDLSFLDSIQIEEGSVATEYEPYKESKNTFYLNSPLLEGDTLEIINGQVYHVHRSGEAILDGSESWNNIGIQGDEGKFIRFSNSNINGVKPRTVLISDKFKSELYTSTSQFTKEFIFAHHSDVNRIDILIEVSKLSDATTEGFKLWLKENPVTVVYELAEPIYESIKTDLSVELFEGVTHISNNSNIPTNMKVIVDRTINRAVEAIELFKVTPTTENLSKARMWVNLLDESIKKDELQGEINSITNLNDMVLERKSATANLDVYVICENILSLSLDTSSVTFEDFSGVEDLEELNAINLTINSSLPYQVNAYMPTEIKGSENSNTMDKDILNIKVNGEAVYNTFTDADTPIVLLDNQPEGNGNLHGVDLMLKGNISHAKDVYKTTIKFEVVQK